MTTMLQAALEYAQRGWYVFPVAPRAKRPITPNGLDDATTDQEVIRKWWTANPNANIGVVCGPSGIVVIDVDTKEGKDGTRAWEEIVRKYGVPKTLTAKTGGGGRHYIFLAPQGVTIKNSVNALAEGIDVRAGRGYIVVPPSVHESGNRYEWIEKTSTMPLPPAITMMLTEKEIFTPASVIVADSQKYARAALESEVENVRTAKVGTRNNTLNVAAFNLGQLVAAGLLDEEEVKRELAKAAIECGLEVDEIMPTIGSGLRAGKKHPREVIQLSPSAQTVSDVHTALAFNPYEPSFPQTLQGVLSGATLEERLPVDVRRSIGAQIVVEKFEEWGKFIRTEEGSTYYFDSQSRKVYSLQTEEWEFFLARMTGINPASPHFPYINNACQMAASQAEPKRVATVSWYDEENKVLYVSRFDGAVYRLDGETIELENNGDTVFFVDDIYQPYKPDLTEDDDSLLVAYTENIPNWKNSRMEGLVYRVWLLSTFFTEIVPVRPFLVVVGQRGSGKTVTLRTTLRLLFGENAEVGGVPTNSRDFILIAARSHLYVLDNMDAFQAWMRDVLARVSTGSVDSVRRLYSDKDMITFRYRVWLAFTARTPDTLRRDDLADRTVLLEVDRLKSFTTERKFAQIIRENRDRFWSQLLNRLNAIVKRLREGGIQTNTTTRIADWESLGRAIAEVEGREKDWDEFVQRVPEVQSQFYLEAEPVAAALFMWLEDPHNHGRVVTANDLQNELKWLLYEDNPPAPDFPRSTIAFGKRLAALIPEVEKEYEVEIGTGTTRETRARRVYKFAPKKK